MDVWRKYPFHGQERIIQFSADTLEFEKYTTRIENEVTRQAVKALALIDGEHYPDVVRDAFAGLQYDVVGAVLLGGTEKLRGGEDYGVPVFDTLDEAFEAIVAEIVVDLSDEPVADPPRRFRLASRALAAGDPYVGADFRFDPVRFGRSRVPRSRSSAPASAWGRPPSPATSPACSRATATSWSSRWDAAGPQEPVVVDREPDLDDLLELSRAGGHAASDYLEGRGARQRRHRRAPPRRRRARGRAVRLQRRRGR